MKPALPVYIGENMFVSRLNYWLVAALVIIPAGCLAFYFYNKPKATTNGKDTI